MRRLLLATAACTAFAGAAEAQVRITCLAIASHLTRQHEPLAEQFNAMQDDIVVDYAAPAQDYSDTHLRLFRASATRTLPDCAFQAYNQLPSLARALAEREQIVDLGPLLAKEGEAWVAQNYTEQMLDLGQVDGVQYGMPFNASVIQWYVNADLVRAAGADPEALPTDWDGIIELAKSIDGLGDEVLGLSFAIEQWGDDWPWQTLILQQGGRMLDPAGDGVAFDEDDRHVEAMRLVRRLVEEGVYDPTIDRDTQLATFAEGRIGLYASSPAGARNTAELVGDAFDLQSDVFTVWDDANGRLPTGGNAGIITASDPEVIEAAWAYLRFVTGAEGQAFTTRVTGYLPTNLRALEPEHLGDYYDENPYYATPSRQYDRAGPWSGYPGTQSEKIWRDQRSVIRAVMLGETNPEDGAAQMVEIAEDLMQR